MSGFKLERTNEGIFKDNYQMMNLKQLSKQIDSIKNRRTVFYVQLHELIKRFYHFENLPDSNLSKNQSAIIFK